MPVGTVIEVASDAGSVLLDIGVPALIGGLLGVFLNHRFSGSRDTENRIAADERRAAQDALAGARELRDAFQSSEEPFQSPSTSGYSHLPGDWERQVQEPLRLVRDETQQQQSDAARTILFMVTLGRDEASSPWLVLQTADRFISQLEHWLRGDRVRATLPSTEDIRVLVRDEEHRAIILAPLAERLDSGNPA